MSIWAGAAVIVGLPGAAAVLHLTLLSVASLAYREARPNTEPVRLRFLTLVPARNEAVVLPQTLPRMLAECRDGDRVLVIADHCSDDTAAVARGAGAEVLERSGDAPPGRSAARQEGLDCARAWEWDAIVMIDADCIIEPGFFAACERALASADVLQARAEAELAGGFFPRMTTAAFAIQGVVVPRGRDRLHLSVRLRGMGMVIRRDIVERYTFRAPGASEDLWYSLDLCLDGVLPRHIDSARLRARSVRSRGGAAEQRTRWEAGRLAAAREFIPKLLKRHDRASLEAAWYLLSPPLALSVLSLSGAAALAWVGGSGWMLGIAVGLLVLLSADIVLALVVARVGARTWLALCAAPAYIGWKAWIQLRAASRALRGHGYFPPTPRD